MALYMVALESLHTSCRAIRESCDIEFDLDQVTLSVILRGLHISSLRLIY